MAGAFGYGADTIDVSLKMAELSLLPAVRKAEPDTLVIADGTSCRHQIKDGTGREALHAARVLAMSLEGSAHASRRLQMIVPKITKPASATAEPASR
jgi:Fe-S oxidoreductase